MKTVTYATFLLLMLNGTSASALSLAPEEFAASRQMACVLAQETLGQISADEYGARTGELLEGFDDAERDNIVAKALGYYDGLMFAIPADSETGVTLRLQDFVSSTTCASGFRAVTLQL